MVDQILHNEKLRAIIIRATFRMDGIGFFTPRDNAQQLGYMNRPKGYSIQPHFHDPMPRTVDFTQEVLFVKSGRVRVDFYDDDRAYVESCELHPGDVILLCSGGHGFRMIEDAEMIEVKVGPYFGAADKVRFEPADESVIKFRDR